MYRRFSSALLRGIGADDSIRGDPIVGTVSALLRISRLPTKRAKAKVRRRRRMRM